jgi:hypothetical protein
MSMRLFRILFASLGVSTAFLASPTMAQTPDGLTPPNEGICDGLKADGITKGLYGLCVAFCEAQDHASILDPMSQTDLEALADSAPAGKILENYNRRKSEADPAMPCIRVEEPCPCWSEADLAEIDGVMWDGSPSNSTLAIEIDGRRCYDNTAAPQFPNIFAYEVSRNTGIVRDTLAQALKLGTENRCQFRRLGNGPDGSTTIVSLTGAQVSDEQHAACVASLKNFQANSGFCPEIQP